MSALHASNLHGARAQRRLASYQMALESLVTAGQIVAGFALLARAEADGLLSHADESCYPMFRILLEACREVGDFYGASSVQAALERLGLFVLTPMAMLRLQNSERQSAL
eukprot:gnl/TRDRNA2_/TRDRNA2_205652_c0_seq1.p1 gnl/TRDRNA2_/TRDRNA2_205652_c0~~gnl/TRDRNA2_/TRDRNA2_205652_c0_seq1.p1  ORF type:complete len:110 (+),score=16.24 gnl/TRDRNA2_/TRDRNA2_205652_c0_seq1:494-823(+)